MQLRGNVKNLKSDVYPVALAVMRLPTDAAPPEEELFFLQKKRFAGREAIAKKKK